MRHWRLFADTAIRLSSHDGKPCIKAIPCLTFKRAKQLPQAMQGYAQAVAQHELHVHVGAGQLQTSRNKNYLRQRYTLCSGVYS
jgi:hypothetical protein